MPRSYYLDVKSAQRVELILNFAWLALSAAIVALWLRISPRTNRGKQLVALAVLTLILFPVISITDDLLAAQNPAETDCCLRKDHTVSNSHSIFPAVSTFAQPFFTDFAFGFLRYTLPGRIPAPALDHPGLAAVQNRPPPLA